MLMLNATAIRDADRLEETGIAEAADIPGGGDDSHDRDIKSSAVAVINAAGIIQMVNKVCRVVFRVWGCPHSH